MLTGRGRVSTMTVTWADIKNGAATMNRRSEQSRTRYAPRAGGDDLQYAANDIPIEARAGPECVSSFPDRTGWTRASTNSPTALATAELHPGRGDGGFSAVGV